MSHILRQARAPFAALPHDIGGDPRIAPIGKAVLLALLFWGRDKDRCWPSNASIGKRVGRSPATVQRTLRSLERIGLIARRKAENPTGREIVLTWRVAYRSDAGLVAADAPLRAPVTPPPAPPMTTEGDVIVGEASKEPVKVQAERPRQESQPIPPAPRLAARPSQEPLQARTAIPTLRTPVATPIAPKALSGPPGVFSLTAVEQGRLAELSKPSRDEVLAWLGTGDVILVGEARKRLKPPREAFPVPATTAEMLLRIRENPSYVPAAAELLSREFDDRKSWSGYLARLKDAWEGRLEPEMLGKAYREATGPKARNPGALFMHALRPGSART